MCGGWIASDTTLTGTEDNNDNDTFGEVGDEVLENRHVWISDIIVKTDNRFSSQILFCF